MNIRGWAVVPIGLWLTVHDAPAHADEHSAIPTREIVWRAALKAVQARGLRVASASLDEGSIETSSGSLGGADISRVIVADATRPPAVWKSGEYRYRIRIVPVNDRLRVRTRAEITAWPAEPVETGDGASRAAVKVQSNDVLEREFAAAFSKAVSEILSE